MRKKPPIPNHKWNSDRPGEHPKADDELGRSSFAQQVARDLRAWRQKDSLVVSLNGEWGSGKTTLANFILWHIEEQASSSGESKPTVVRFNPWQWSGQDKLTEGFFDQISDAFRTNRLRGKASVQKLARFWEGLKVITIAGGEVATDLQQSLVAAAALMAGGSGMVAKYATNEVVKSVFGVASPVLLGIAGICAVYAPLAEKLADVFNWSGKKERSLDQTRRNLIKELEKLEAPVIVVVDDIDRLTKSEIRLLVQLVKANADFPNVIYLLLYQKTVVTSALGELVGERGQDYLKKIVQVELEVPVAPEHEMLRFFRAQIQPVFSTAKIRWEKDRWENVFSEGIWPYFRTPRDIKRFKGALEFYFEAHVDHGVLEVNPIDLIILETLRMFDPTAYLAVSSAFQKQRDFFLESLFFDKEAKDRLMLGIEELVKRDGLSSREKERLKVLLYELFPQARETFSGSGRYEQEWERNLRICHSKLFHRYFQLGGEPGDVSAAFIERLLNPTNGRDQLRELLKSSFERIPFPALMERLYAVSTDIPKSLIQPMITAVFDVSDGLPEAKADMFSKDPARLVADLVVRLIRCIEDQSERSVVLKSAATASLGITGPIFAVLRLLPTKDDEGLQRIPDIPLEELKAVQASLLPKLWSVARSGQLWGMRKGSVLFYILSKWSKALEFRKWLDDELRNPKTAVAFLRTTLKETQVSNHRGTRTVYSLDPKEVEQFIELKELASFTANSNASTELEKVAIEKLQVAIARREKGERSAPIYLLSYDEKGNFLSDPSDSIS